MLLPKIRNPQGHPKTYFDPQYAAWKEDKLYRPRAKGLENVHVMRAGNTFILANVKADGCCVILNREFIKDTGLNFVTLEQFVSASLLLKGQAWTRVLDCLWYMLGFGMVAQDEEGRGQYIIKSFSDNFEEVNPSANPRPLAEGEEDDEHNGNNEDGGLH